MHKIISKLSLLTVTVATIAGLSGGTVFAAKPAAHTKPGGGGKTASVPLGNDISWPQCGRRLPSGQAFGIVGVNDGLANTTNPCLSKELDWAGQSKGGTGQPSAALYVNTANPGLIGSWWPTSNTYGGTTVDNPYGTCDGSDDAACAYMYGYAKAYDDANIRGVSNPGSYLWWLDVETVNSWEFDNKTANAADLEGMTAYFESIGATVGIYSTSYQWGQIVGQTSPTSNLNGLKSWLAGASSQNAAISACSLDPLTSGGTVTVTQFVQKNLDYDYSCI